MFEQSTACAVCLVLLSVGCVSPAPAPDKLRQMADAAEDWKVDGRDERPLKFQVLAREGEDGWSCQVVDTRKAGRSRIGAAGDNLVASDDDGTLSLVPGDAPGLRAGIHRSSNKLRGAVLADLDPAAPGLEAATAGYSKQMLILHGRDGTWSPKVVAADDDRFHHLACGRLPGYSGLCLAGASFSGRLVVVHRTEDRQAAGVQRRPAPLPLHPPLHLGTCDSRSGSGP